VEAVEPEAAAALDAFRVAEDRGRDAREYARRQEAEAERIKDTGSAEEVTDARVRADVADGVAADREAAAVKAKADLDGLDRDLGEARENLEEAERSLRAAQAAAGVPAGIAPVSDATVRLNFAYMQSDAVWDALSDKDKHRVRDASTPRALMTDQEWQAMLRAATQAAGL
jgi:hypothetical protein